MNKLIWGSLFLILISAGSAFANEATYEKLLAKGIMELESGNFSVAATEFQSALGIKPDDPEATLYLGITYSREKNPRAEEVLKKALLLEPGNPTTNYELGTLYMAGQVYTEAEDYFENLLTIAPDTDFARRAQEYLLKIKAIKKEKTWAFKFLAGMQYDSNVILNADNTPLPGDITRKSDWRGLINPSISFYPVRTEKGEFEVGYSLYQSLHAKLDDYDVTQNQLELRGRYRLTPEFTSTISYSFEYLLLGGRTYDFANTLSPSLIYTEEDGSTTAVEFRIRDTQYWVRDGGPDRSGPAITAGAVHKFPLDTSAMARIGYYHEEEDPNDLSWKSYGNLLLAGVTATGPWNITLDITGDYNRKVYPDFAGGRRVDDLYNAGATAIRTFFDDYSLILSYAYSRSLSSDPLYTYSRSITSLMLNVRY